MRKRPTLIPLALLFLVLVVGCNRPISSTPEPTHTPTTSATDTPSPTVAPIPSITPDDEDLSPRLPISTLMPTQPVVILSIHMKTVTEGFAVAAPAGFILYTRDGGQTWKEITPPDALVIAEPATVTPVTEFHGLFGSWVYYLGSDQVWGSFDRGLSWRAGPIDAYPTAFAARLTFADDDNGWLLQSVESGLGSERVALFRTTNRGVSWEEIVNPYESEYLQSCLKTGISFSSPRIGWVTYDCQGNYAQAFLDISRDGGTTWQESTLPLPEGAAQSPENGYCTSNDPDPLLGALILDCFTFEGDTKYTTSYLYRTRDDGLTWEILPYPGGELFFVGRNELVAAAREIYRSDDGGVSWTRIKIVSWDGQFNFSSSNLAWAVARSGDEIALVMSTDGGRTWELLTPIIGQN